MPDEAPKSTQNISAGDGSNNFQAAGDINIHNHAATVPAQPLIQRPTNAEIAKFDPKVAEIINVADKAAEHHLLMSSRSPLGRLILYIVLLTWLVWFLYKYGPILLAWFHR
jgi:hypothetical protein